MLVDDTQCDPGTWYFRSTAFPETAPSIPKRDAKALGNLHTYAIDLATGHVLDSSRIPQAADSAFIDPLTVLPRNLVDNKGREFIYDRLPLVSLRYKSGGTSHYLRLLPRVTDLRIYADLALMQHVPSKPPKPQAPFLLAYGLSRGYVVWQLSADDLNPDAAPEIVPWVLGADAETLLVEHDQVVFALSARTAEKIWQTTLPRQRPAQGGFCLSLAGRDRDLLVVSSEQRLFALHWDTGKVAWEFNTGCRVLPWPTIAGDRVLVAMREDKAQTPTQPPADVAAPPVAIGDRRRLPEIGEWLMPSLCLALLLGWLIKFRAHWHPSLATPECPLRARLEWVTLMLFIAGFTFLWYHVFLLTRWPTRVCQLTAWLALAASALCVVSAVRARLSHRSGDQQNQHALPPGTHG